MSKTAESDKERMERAEKLRRHRDTFITVIEKYTQPEGQAVLIQMFDLMMQQAESHGALIGIDQLNRTLAINLFEGL